MSDTVYIGTDVNFRGDTAAEATVITKYRAGDFKNRVEYQFLIDGSSAVLKSISPELDSYPVQKAEATRALAAEKVRELPFVQAVTMFPEYE